MKLELIREEVEKVKPQIVRITKESGIPLIGCIAFGIIDRGTNLLQVRCTSFCNMNCSFCSTDAGPYSKRHKVNYIVDVDYLVEEVEKIAKIKGEELIVFLDSVGEPMSHPDFIELVKKLKTIREVKEIVVITNGTFLTKEKIDLLKEAGLSRINLSFHSLNPEKAKNLFGMNGYDLEKVIELIHYIKEKKLDMMLTPVWIPGINDEDIEEIIKFVKQVDCKIGLQKYEEYRHSRKIKGAKNQTYWKFYNKVEEWEKTYDLKLVVNAEELNVKKRDRIQEIFNVGDKVNVEIICEGWMPGQMIGKASGRCISINNCNREVGDRLKVNILQNKNNIYLAE